MHALQLDQLTDGAENFVYRDGGWITNSGYCVSTARGQALTMKFYQRHGRAPCSPTQEPATPKRSSKAKMARVATIRAAVKKARAARARK